MDIVQLTEKNMLAYSGAVNQSRAIPDARTGLKPIHRKILYEMYADKIKSSGKYKKCAYMVGQIIARFSEHGDSATYDALVRLAQPWIQRYCLLDFHGNNGSPFGDPAAAMRYTEAKLSKMTEQGFLTGLEKENVDWIPNFTNEEDEPVTLPAIFPGLFCLPNQGIGYSIACNFLTYNLQEVLTTIEKYLKHEDYNVIQYDLASGGTIVNPQIMEQIQRTGKGSVIVESKYEIIDNKIYITELPFNVMFDDVYNNIVELVEKEEISGIANLTNASGNGKMKMVIEIDGRANPETVLSILFQKTKLRNSYGVNQVALVNNTPKLLNFKEMMDVYIEHNLSCILREYQYDYNKTLARINILKGLLIALANIDRVIEIIRSGNIGPIGPSQILMEEFGFDEFQVKAILDMKLARLSRLEEEKLQKELQEKEEFAAYCSQVINQEEKRIEILIERMRDLAKKFDDGRRTKIEQKTIKKINTTKEAAIIIPEDVVVMLNEKGYIKSVPIKNFKVTKRNSAGTSIDDEIVDVVKTNTQDMLVLFSNLGRMFRISAGDIKQCDMKDKGTALGSVVKFQPNEKVVRFLSVNKDNGKEYLLFTTKNGLVKKTEKKEFVGTTRNINGIKATTIKDGDSLQSIQFIDNEDIIMITRNGYSIRYDSGLITPTGKAASGVKGINLTDDCVVSSIIVSSLGDYIFVATESGNGKRIPLQLFTPQGRGGKGNRCVSSGEKIAGAAQVQNEDKVLIIGKDKTITVSAGNVTEATKAAQGAKLLKNSNIIQIYKLKG